MTAIISQREVGRFIEYMKQAKMINRWATPAGVHEAMVYAFTPGLGLDGMYECDDLTCSERVLWSGAKCDRHFAAEGVAQYFIGDAGDEKP